MMSAQKKISLTVTSTGPMKAKRPCRAVGWGQDGQERVLEGKITELCVSFDGQARFSLRILKDGSVSFYSIRDMYETSVPREVRFKNDRPWATLARKDVS